MNELGSVRVQEFQVGSIRYRRAARAVHKTICDLCMCIGLGKSAIPGLLTAHVPEWREVLEKHGWHVRPFVERYYHAKSPQPDSGADEDGPAKTLSAVWDRVRAEPDFQHALRQSTLEVRIQNLLRLNQELLGGWDPDSVTEAIHFEHTKAATERRKGPGDTAGSTYQSAVFLGSCGGLCSRGSVAEPTQDQEHPENRPSSHLESPGPADVTTPQRAQPEWQFTRHSGMYEIAGCGERNYVKELVGLRYIERLIREPGRAVPYSELIAEDSPDRATEAEKHTADDGLDSDIGSYQPVYDKEALMGFNKRLNEINAELEKAKEWGDTAQQERLEKEHAEICATVEKATGIGGRQRNLDRQSENQRLRIRQALQRAFEKLREVGLPKLAEHLETNTSTELGAYKYAPQPVPSWSLGQN